MKKIIEDNFIKTELKKLRNKGMKIGLCHGVFDLLHIGHIKHFEEAKKNCDILIVSITHDKFINKGPGRPAFNHNIRMESISALENIDYVYYMKALCYYEQVTHEGLDGKFNELALINLNQVIKRFPESKYAKDSYQKIVLVKSNIAAKHMMIGRFYQKEEKYTASLNRYKIVVDSFDETKFVPEALYRISEIYYNLGMIEDSKKTGAILGYNYPDSKWYKYIYDALTKKDKGSIFSKSFNKVFN